MNNFYIRKIKEYFPKEDMYIFNKKDLESFLLLEETIEYLCEVGIPNKQIISYSSINTKKPYKFEIDSVHYISLCNRSYAPSGLAIRESDNAVGNYFPKGEFKQVTFIDNCENIIQFVLYFIINEIEEKNMDNFLDEEAKKRGLDPESGEWKLSDELDKLENIKSYLVVRKIGELLKKIDSKGMLHEGQISGLISDTEYVRGYLFDIDFLDFDTYEKCYDLACTETYDEELKKIGFDFTEVYAVRDGVITVEEYLNNNIKRR